MNKLFTLLAIMVLGSLAHAQLAFSPALNNGELVLSSAQTYVYLTNQGTLPLTTSLSIPLNPQGIVIGINRCALIKAKQTCYLIVSYNSYRANSPPATVNLLNNAISIATLKYNPAPPPTNIESISVNPTSLSLGTISSSGLTLTQNITVTNTGNVSLSPIVTSNNSNLQILSNSCLSSILPTNTCIVGVSYNAQSSTPNGVLSGLVVSVKATSSSTAIEIPVSGTLDLPPALVASSSGSTSSGGGQLGEFFVKAIALNAFAYNAVSNKLYSWGMNFESGSTIGHEQINPVPINIGSVLGGKTLKKIALSNDHGCAIASDDQAYCWGGTYSGPSLGRGDYSTSNNFIPAAVDTSGVLAGKTIKQIGVGQYYSCAIASDDKAYCWGVNTDGELGNGDMNRMSQSSPVAVYMGGVLAGKTIKQLNVEQSAVCVIASDNKSYCWGAGNLGSGQDPSSLDVNGNYYRDVPTAVAMTGPLLGKSVKYLATSFNNSCLITTENQGYCWGINYSGQLGDGTTNEAWAPVPILTNGPLNGKQIESIKIGGGGAFALTTEGRVYAWGANYNGNLGVNGDVNLNYEPTEIYMSGALAGKTIKQLETSLNSGFSCVLASDDLPYCWGYNSQGQLGSGLTGIALPYALSPTAVVSNGALAGKTVKNISISLGDSICVSGSDNNVYCWGDNNYGQLGDGTRIKKPYPVLAPTP